jgi:hypothetical protein
MTNQSQAQCEIGEPRVPRHVGCHRTVDGWRRGGRRWRIPDDEQGMLMSRFPTPFTLVYRRLKTAPKVPFSATFRAARRALDREISLRMSFRRQQIGTEMSPSGQSGNLVAQGSPKVPHQRPLIVHYLKLLTKAIFTLWRTCVRTLQASQTPRRIVRCPSSSRDRLPPPSVGRRRA